MKVAMTRLHQEETCCVWLLTWRRIDGLDVLDPLLNRGVQHAQQPMGSSLNRCVLGIRFLGGGDGFIFSHIWSRQTGEGDLPGMPRDELLLHVFAKTTPAIAKKKRRLVLS